MLYLKKRRLKKMSEKEKIESGEEVNDGVDYITAINEMKKTTVPKEKYEKLAEENKRLLESLVAGEKIEPKEEEKIDVKALRKELYSGECELNNLEYVDKTLKLRKALIDAGERDPFLPIGDKVDITSETIEKAETVAQVLQECVDFAEGDSGIFTAELQRRTKDTMRYNRK